MRILKGPASAEISVKNSRFLAEAFPVTAQEAARAALKTKKEDYKDAAHVVHAFVIGPQAEILGSSDDGEPPGTAGRPSLEILKGSGITNVMVTVTRWFGGTLLGTGGLVKAYGDAVKAVLSSVQTEELVAMRDFSFELPYDQYERAKRLFAELAVCVEREDFAVAISVTGSVPESASAALVRGITELSAGRVSVTLSKESRMGRKT